MVVFRAVENRSLPIPAFPVSDFYQGITGSIPLRLPSTVYTQVGDLFASVIISTILLLFIKIFHS